MAKPLVGLFVSGDLMLGVPVLSALESVCGEVQRILSGRTLMDRLESNEVDLLVLDLEAADVDLEALSERIRTTGRPWAVGYAPHVATGRLQAARDAGFTAVLTRGQAASQLAGILAQVVAQKTGPVT